MDFKKLVPHIIAIAIFLGLSMIYFYPQLQGKKLNASDVKNYVAASKEIKDYKKETGKTTLWTNAMFGGMPAYQISMPTHNQLNIVNKMFRLFLTGPISMFMGLMIGLYIFFQILKIDVRISILVSVAFAYSTYFLSLAEAGHNTKIGAIAYLGLILGGFYLVFEKHKFTLGALLFALGVGLELLANHVQMTYYFIIVMVVLSIAEAISHYRAKQSTLFLKGTAWLIAAGIIASLTASSRLLPTYEYMQDTMRGNPILVNDSNESNSTSSSVKEGLAWDYAMNWSQGFSDILSAIVPGIAGGGNEPLANDSKLRIDLSRKGVNLDRFYLYWGKMDSTGGPPYISIVLWFFFIYGMFAMKGPFRIGLGVSLLIVLMISLGRNLEWFNKFLFNYLPYFDKWRAHASIMTITTFLVSVGAGLGLHQLLSTLIKKKPKPDWKSIKRAGYILGGILLFTLIYGIFSDFTSGNDAQFAQLDIQDSMITARKSLFYSTFFRSLAFGIITFGIVWFMSKKSFNWQYGLYGLGILALIDVWGIGRKYLSTDNFVKSNQYESNFQPRQVDQIILKDADPYFRVLDLTVNTFSSAIPSYFHKTIGGYHAAKLQRYNDVIERHISRNNQQVLNMLNTKYIISNGQNNQPQLYPNTQALGNAWFVSRYMLVSSANEEINALNGLDPAEMAIVHKEFENELSGFQPQKEGTIALVDYKPDQLTYQSKSSSEQMAVFSDIWYGPNKGWNAYIDGEKVDHFRANYLLRAMRVPQGEHEIVFSFEPKSYEYGKIITILSSLIILIGLLIVLFKDYFTGLLKRN